MRKSKISIFIGILLVMVIIVYNIWNTSTLLAEVHQGVKQTGMIASESGFILRSEGKVNMSVKSSVIEGNVKITLQNKNREILYIFKSNCKQKESFSLESGDYFIRIDGKKFKGRFDIVIRKG